jgi:hypothetical protein
MVMEYVTFVSEQRSYRVYRGVGGNGRLLKERRDGPPLHDLSAASQPTLWTCSQSSGTEKTVIERLSLPALSSETITWNGGRVGALACAADGQSAMALELPSDIGEQPCLWLWSRAAWKRVESPVVPDISSKLAWLDASRIAYESAARRLVNLDIETGHVESGPPGCCPAAAPKRSEWYAIDDGHVRRFPFERGLSDPPGTLDDLSFGHVTMLRVTHDGEVFTWTEPTLGYSSRGFIQKRGEPRQRFPQIDHGVGAVLGPFEIEE